MRIPSATSSRSGLRLNLTPLIDVIFNLIIFFLAAAHFARNEPVSAVELPTATPRPSELESPRRLTVTVAPGPVFDVNGREHPREVILAMIETETKSDDQRPLELRLRADRSIPFGEIEPLLVAAARAGISDVQFAVKARE